MKDIIYRQDAINAVCKACYIADDGDYSECEAYNRPDDDWCEELVALRDVPSVKLDWKDAVNIIFENGDEYSAILSILNRLKIRDDKMAYTMKVLKAEKNAIWRICIGNAPNKDKIKDILSLMDGDESVL